jgi:hypothetical protein
VYPGVGAPGVKDQPLGVPGAVNEPLLHVYVDVPEGKLVGVLVAH